MRLLLREELRRCFGGIGMRLSLLLGGAIAVAHIIQYGIANHMLLLSMDYSKASLAHPLSVAENWLAGNSYNLESFLYFLLIPLLAVLPYGTSYFDEVIKGVLHNMFTRCSRKKYLLSKFVAAFLGGAAAVVFPLLLNLIATMMILPNSLPQSILPGNGMNAAKWCYLLYFQHTTGYLLLYLLIDFVFGGLFAVFALAAGFFLKHRVTVAMSAFFFQFLLYVAFELFGADRYSSVFFLQAGYGVSSLSVVMGYIFILGIVSAVVFVILGEKKDVF